jgi:hypothetical protein
MVKTKHQFVMTDDYIAEAQRLSIAQNKTLKLFYQTWWVWWLPRPVILGFVLYLLLNHAESSAALFGFLLIFHFAAEWLGRRNLAKARNRVRTKNTTSTVTMSEKGVELDGANGSSQIKWAAMLSPAIYPSGVLIKFSRFAMVWLPDKALIEGSAADVRQLLADNVIDGKPV